MEGNGPVRLINLMKKHGFNKDLSVSLATVTSAVPDIKIQVDGMKIELDKDDLIIAEHLTRHERIVTIEHVENADRDLGASIVQDHIDTDDFAAPYTSYKHSYVKLTNEDVLKIGDRVIVVSDKDQEYYVLDRAVIL